MRPIILFFFLLHLSTGAFSQKTEKENFITIEKFPKARTYSIDLTFYDGENNHYNRAQSYIENMFPQLSYLDLVKKDGDIVVKIFAADPMELPEARKSQRWAELLNKYEKIQPISVNSHPNVIAYFQPIVISLEKKDSSFYTLESIGQYFKRELIAKTTTPDVPLGLYSQNAVLRTAYPGRETERANVLSNLNFMRIHLNDITQ